MGGNKSHKVDSTHQGSSRTERLKRFGKQSKQAAVLPVSDSDTMPITSGHADHHVGAAQGKFAQPAQLPLPVSSLHATVSGVPHTQLVQHTMHQLSRTLSSQPLGNIPHVLETASASNASSAQEGAPAVHARLSGQYQNPSVEKDVQGGLAPVLQPFLASSASERAESQVHAGSAQPGTTPTAVEAISDRQQQQHGTGHMGGVRQLEQHHMQDPGTDQGQPQRQPQGQDQGQAQEEDEIRSDAGGRQLVAEAQTGNALQQLISRAQKLKHQLDAHAERKASM